MGDPKRNEVFASFIRRNFPKAETALVVADGHGLLARKLANKKFKVRVIENNPRFAGRRHKRIQYEKGWFTRNTSVVEDVVVGMHPDEATAEIILAAESAKKGWAVVPCCLKGVEASGVHNFAGWLRKLASLAPCRSTHLKMTGKNTVLWSK